MSKNTRNPGPNNLKAGSQSKGSGGSKPDNSKTNRAHTASTTHDTTPSAILKKPVSAPAGSSIVRMDLPLSKRAIAVSEMIGKSEGKKEPQRDNRASKDLVRETDDFGVVISFRSAFGFIQSIYSDDSYYFSEKEFYQDMKTGDFVMFSIRNGPKGLAAQNVRFLPLSSATVAVREVKGTISRSHDRHKSNLGLIEIDSLSTLALSEAAKQSIQNRYHGAVPFSDTAIDRESLPKNHFLDRGDYVSFSLLTLRGDQYFVASDLHFLQLKRDRAITQQIERMLAAGAVREMGVVSAVKNQEYGFIRAQDRKDELYFRIDNVENESGVTIREGTEVEFFVIAEMVRGRLCERAIHLKIIPSGTVQFEIVVKSHVLLTVLQEPGAPPADEIPGIGALDEELDTQASTGTSGSTIRNIDLWHRCMPEDLIVRKGDRLAVNIHYYRPEKIFFARNVKVVQFFPLGRDFGQIVTIKEQIFGFIKSEIRKVDLYFKMSQVLQANGEIVKDSEEVKKGQYVTFDCLTEDGGKLRAIRVQQATPSEILEWTEGSSEDLVIKKDLIGMVVRSTNKRDSTGLIKVSPSLFKDLQEVVFQDPWIVQGFDRFSQISGWNTMELASLPDVWRKLCQEVLDQRFADSLSYEVQSASVGGGAVEKVLKVWKKTEAEKEAATKKKNEEAAEPQESSQEEGKPTAATTLTERSLRLLSKESTFSFLKEDYLSEDLAPLMNDVEVIFDVVWDRLKNKRVAKRIRLTDEAIVAENEEEEAKRVGVIDTLIQSQYRGGFIRVLHSDEKLFWMGKAANGGGGEEEGNNSGDFVVDQEVSFELRKRGGLRCAVNVQTLPKGSLSKEETLPALFTAVVVSTSTTTSNNQAEVVLVDVAEDPVLSLRYLDVKLLETAFQLHLPSSSSAAATTTTTVNNNSNSTSSEETAAKAASPVEAIVPPSTTIAMTEIETVEGQLAATAISEENSTPNPVITTTTATTTTNSSSESSSTSRVEYKAKYFPVLPRVPLSAPMTEETTNTTSIAGLKAGDVVQCQAVVDWAVKRSPLRVSSLSALATSTAIKRKGKIQIAKFRLKAPVLQQLSSMVSAEQWKRYRVNELDWTEIQEISAEKKMGATPNALVEERVATPVPPAPVFGTFFCLCQELLDQNYRPLTEAVELGEEVEFWSLPQWPHLALGVTVLPKRDFGFGSKLSSFSSSATAAAASASSSGVNDRLKTKVAGTNLITMAKGPPTDTAAGFEAGWREIDSAAIAALPWAALLSHLQE